MEKKPYEVLLDRIQNADNVTPGNKAGLTDFLTYEHPGDVLFTKWDYPQIIERGKGNRIWDVDGKEYIDCISGMSAMNLGHAEKRIADAMYDQYMNKLDFWFDFPTPERLKLVKRLCDITPGDFPKRVRLALSGSDAIENAIRLARYATKRQHIISFYGAYHGQNTATMGLTGSGRMTSYYNPMPAQDNCLHQFPYPYDYRNPYGDEDGIECARRCVKVIDEMMSTGVTPLGAPDAGICNVAALIVEPCQSSAGYIIPPEGFLTELRKLADKYGFLLIFDEVQTGMGRTGYLFAHQMYGVEPDIFTSAKALGGGIPIGAVCAGKKVASAFEPGDHGTTFGGNPFATAAGLAVFDIFEKEHLVENAGKMGKYFKEKLTELQNKYSDKITDVRNAGLLIGIQLEDSIAKTVFNKLFENKMLTSLCGGNTIRIAPPLIIKETDINIFIDTLNNILEEL